MRNTLKSYYHKFSKNYQEQYLLGREFLYLKTCKRVLDIGCGEGEFVKLSPKKIVGIDNNKKSVSLCKKQGLNVIYGNVTRIPFEKDSFDGVRCAHVIEHLLPKDAHKMLNEVGRVLKRGGIFLLSTPILWEGFYNDFTHIKPYSPESIVRYLVTEGKQKTLPDIRARFDKIDLFWRYRPLPYLGKISYLLSNYLYQYGVHSFKKDAYTLVLKKI